MDRASEAEKIKLEHDAVKLFLRCYEEQFSVPMRHIWHNQPNKPDVSCYQGEYKLDIEVAHFYASEQEAMAVLGRPLSLSIQRELAAMSQTVNSDPLSIGLQRLLNQKAKKKYDSERVWLLIRNASPIYHSEDFKRLKNSWAIPDSHPFEEVWLLCDFYQGELLQLF
ncbi:MULTISPECIES: hypothetical protein [Pseudoalteromonas]|uniref:Uncharacterized protein n=1 Tax=Pseudoalteromonas peptidolytica F12-50-A1 TaxID=1315280 RepID=A0A8I0MZJ4_9GAMM|nr:MULTISPECIES: hypothetical protein [Pseudoalteromonas]MBE0348207.1 hypothetical protein [Pseudoalteromonas peptidolytica F12-50-A1]NLR15456.1 hypothetical protein [Pseudoalteromonas peptidolytica]RRS09572.1 hypothetical protein EAG18_06405 [Pseudoalteromonas sp. J010]RXF04443.1 hypothetical protein D9603_06010 [Pseudoalteromonas sp. PS5]GEK08586.1 hypothetical protein PPE03_08350 [Pseudoalteromonas peptidolytica]